jgi:hypothetical protein
MAAMNVDTNPDPINHDFIFVACGASTSQSYYYRALTKISSFGYYTIPNSIIELHSNTSNIREEAIIYLAGIKNCVEEIVSRETKDGYREAYLPPLVFKPSFPAVQNNIQALLTGLYHVSNNNIIPILDNTGILNPMSYANIETIIMKYLQNKQLPTKNSNINLRFLCNRKFVNSAEVSTKIPFFSLHNLKLEHLREAQPVTLFAPEPSKYLEFTTEELNNRNFFNRIKLFRIPTNLAYINSRAQQFGSKPLNGFYTQGCGINMLYFWNVILFQNEATSRVSTLYKNGTSFFTTMDYLQDRIPGLSGLKMVELQFNNYMCIVQLIKIMYRLGHLNNTNWEWFPIKQYTSTEKTMSNMGHTYSLVYTPNFVDKNGNNSFLRVVDPQQNVYLQPFENYLSSILTIYYPNDASPSIDKFKFGLAFHSLNEGLSHNIFEELNSACVIKNHISSRSYKPRVQWGGKSIVASNVTDSFITNIMKSKDNPQILMKPIIQKQTPSVKTNMNNNKLIEHAVQVKEVLIKFNDVDVFVSEDFNDMIETMNETDNFVHINKGGKRKTRKNKSKRRLHVSKHKNNNKKNKQAKKSKVVKRKTKMSRKNKRN